MTDPQRGVRSGGRSLRRTGAGAVTARGGEPPWQACDPVAMQPRRAELPLLSPVENGDLTWDELARGEPELSSWCADRWLGAWRRLRPVRRPRRARDDTPTWHSLAEQVLRARAATRQRQDRTPVHAGWLRDPVLRRRSTGTGRQGGDVVVVTDGVEHREPISTIAAAARLVGVEAGAPADSCTTPRPTPHPDARSSCTRVRHGSSPTGTGSHARCSKRCAATTGKTDSRTQLWPEHFGSRHRPRRRSAGTRGHLRRLAGDAAQPEPYLYVTHWKEDVPPDPFWNETAFAGASLAYATLLGVDGQRSTALDFFRTGLAVLGVPAT